MRKAKIEIEPLTGGVWKWSLVGQGVCVTSDGWQKTKKLSEAAARRWAKKYFIEVEVER